MFQTLTFYHSTLRWLVLLSLIYAIIRAAKGYYSGRPFSATDNAVRHWTATIAHLQLALGMWLYTQSPIIRYFWKNVKDSLPDRNLLFFGIVHIGLMLTAIVVVTIGSAKARRKEKDKEKFGTMLLWFTAGLLLILMAIPWPWSPLAQRPYFR